MHTRAVPTSFVLPGSRRGRHTRVIIGIVICVASLLLSFRVGMMYGLRFCSSATMESNIASRMGASTTHRVSPTRAPEVATPQPAVPATEVGSSPLPYRAFLEQIYFNASNVLAYGNHTPAAINAFLLHRRRRNEGEGSTVPYDGTLFLVPVNEGYLDFGLNLMCSLLNVSRHSPPMQKGTPLSLVRGSLEGFVFIAMDEPAHRQLAQMQLPVIRDPDVPFITSKSAAWADPKFHSLVCTKLIPVLRALRQGLRVVLTDADITFLSNPTPYFRSDVSLTFSIGSCHKDLPDNFHFTAEGIEKLNTGFYVAHPTEEVVTLFSKALEVCRTSSLTGDQPAINSVIQSDWNSGALKAIRSDTTAPTYSYGFFDGCLFANGCVFFKHLCANTTSYPSHAQRWMSSELRAKPRNGSPVLVHANFLVGKKNKIKHLSKYQLWDSMCISHFRSRLTE